LPNTGKGELRIIRATRRKKILSHSYNNIISLTNVATSGVSLTLKGIVEGFPGCLRTPLTIVISVRKVMQDEPYSRLEKTPARVKTGGHQEEKKSSPHGLGECYSKKGGFFPPPSGASKARKTRVRKN